MRNMKSSERKFPRSLAIGALMSLRTILGVLNAWRRSQSIGRPHSIFDLVRRVQKETDQISFRRQMAMDRIGRSRSPVGF